MRPIATTELPPCPPQHVLDLRAWCLDRVELITGEQPETPIARFVHARAVEHLKGACDGQALEHLHAALGQVSSLEEISRLLTLNSARADVAAPALAVGDSEAVIG